MKVSLFWDKKPTSEAWITIPRWASENTKGTRILLSLWEQDKPYILGCCMDFPGLFPTCPTSKSDFFQKLHEMRMRYEKILLYIILTDQNYLVQNQEKIYTKCKRFMFFLAPKLSIVRQDSRGKTINYMIMLNIWYLFKMLFQILICGIFNQKG